MQEAEELIRSSKLALPVSKARLITALVGEPPRKGQLAEIRSKQPVG